MKTLLLSIIFSLCGNIEDPCLTNPYVYPDIDIPTGVPLVCPEGQDFDWDCVQRAYQRYYIHMIAAYSDAAAQYEAACDRYRHGEDQCEKEFQKCLDSGNNPEYCHNQVWTYCIVKVTEAFEMEANEIEKDLQEQINSITSQLYSDILDCCVDVEENQSGIDYDWSEYVTSLPDGNTLTVQVPYPSICNDGWEIPPPPDVMCDEDEVLLPDCVGYCQFQYYSKANTIKNIIDSEISIICSNYSDKIDSCFSSLEICIESNPVHVCIESFRNCTKDPMGEFLDDFMDVMFLADALMDPIIAEFESCVENCCVEFK